MKKAPAPKRKAASLSRRGAGVRTLALREGGRLTVSAEAGGEALRVVGPDGAVRVEVLVTPEGAVLRLAGPSVAIETAGAFAVRCASFRVEAESIALGASGDLVQRAGRGLTLRAGHDASLSAQAVSVEARRGDVALAANDDVALNGERVLLNCPSEDEAAERARAATSLKELLELPFTAPGSPRRLPPSAPVPEETP